MATQQPQASPTASRQVLALLDSYHEKIFRIEALERRIDARAVQTRRRLTNLLVESTRRSNGSHRQSHMRVFVTHKLVPPPPPPPPDPTVTILVMPDPPPPEYEIQIEGKLLVGHLDHASALKYDRNSGYVAPVDDLDRSKGEPEEAEVPAINFTHFFARVVVELEPLYVQKPNPMSKKAITKSPPPGKKSRRGSTKSPNPAAAVEEEIDPSSLVRGAITTMEWKKGMTGDAHMFCFRYPMPSPPGYHLMPHSVASKIRLYSARHDDLWLPNDTIPALVTLFSSHITADEPAPAQAPTGTAAAASTSTKSKKRKADDITPPPSSSSSVTGTVAAVVSAAGSAGGGSDDKSSLSPSPKPLSLENSIDIPQGFSWKEICMAFFVYIQDRKLVDPADKSVIVCDEILRQLFSVDRFPFSQLQRVLAQNRLFVKISDEPVELAYLLKPVTALPSNDRQMLSSSQSDMHKSSLLQLDMDVSVPTLFPFRCRELLRRIKRRELEYTSSRTKARYLLSARRPKSDESAKLLIDEVVGGRAIDTELQPVLAALAKSTPPNTEARMASHYDMRLGYLVERAREQFQAAHEAWQVVDAVVARIGRNRVPAASAPPTLDETEKAATTVAVPPSEPAR